MGLLIPRKEDTKTIYKHTVATAVREDLEIKEKENMNISGMNMYFTNKLLES